MTAFLLPRLYPIIDTDSLEKRQFSSIAMAQALLDAGVGIVQFRHKRAWTEDVFQQARQIAALCRAAQATFVLNDRADYARLLGGAVHVGQDDLPPAAVRRVVGSGVIGFSTHNCEQILRGASEDVNYLALGPIYETTSKLQPDASLGLEGLRLLRPLTIKPLVAIGGINQSNAREVLAAGADSLALIGALLPSNCNANTVRSLARDWLRLLS